jgi:hypothetical protein
MAHYDLRFMDNILRVEYRVDGAGLIFVGRGVFWEVHNMPSLFYPLLTLLLFFVFFSSSSSSYCRASVANAPECTAAILAYCTTLRRSSSHH